MRELARAGNTVLVVEHDAGDRAGVRSRRRARARAPAPHGGTHPLRRDARRARASARTCPRGGRGARARATPQAAREPAAWLDVRGARAQQPRTRVDVTIPLGVVCAITGPSGSGKSHARRGDPLPRGRARARATCRVDRPGPHDAHRRASARSQRAVLVDQSPLGRTARGNAATYTKAWDRIRARFAAEPEARRRGPHRRALLVQRGPAGPLRGRAAGEGYETVEMQFLADVRSSARSARASASSRKCLAVTPPGARTSPTSSR